MSDLKYNLIDVSGQGNITVVYDGEMYVANSEHPNWKAIVAGALDGDAAVVDLFDPAKTVAQKFERLSERVTVSGGTIFFDGEPVDNSLTKQVVRFLDEGQDDYKPLVAFFEKVATNPTEHSREQLFRFLESHNITILEDGDIILYKGVRSDGEDGWTSIHAGPAIVNGESVNGYVPQPEGAIIEMARSKVAHDPEIACHTGLHAGTFAYAKSFSGGNVIKVKVNPRDVVSVPNDHADQKVRVCRYTVLSVEKVAEETPVVYEAPAKAEEFVVGDRVRLIGNEWVDPYTQTTRTDLLTDPLYYLKAGDEGEVVEGEEFWEKHNVYVKFDANQNDRLYVKPSSLELVDEDEDDDEYDDDDFGCGDPYCCT